MNRIVPGPCNQFLCILLANNAHSIDIVLGIAAVGTKVIDDFVKMSLGGSTTVLTNGTASETWVNAASTCHFGPSVVQIGGRDGGSKKDKTNETNVSHFDALGVDLGSLVIPGNDFVINEAVTCKLNFRSLDSDKPINAKFEVKIPKASILDVYLRFGFSLAYQELKEDMVIAIPNVEDDGEVQFKPRKPIWQVVSKKNSASSSGTKKNSKVSRKVTSSNNPFDVLNMIEEGDELRSNGGLSNLGKKYVQDVMIEGTLVLLDDDGKPLKPSKSMLLSSSNVVFKNLDDVVNEDNDSEMEKLYDENVSYMAFTGFNVNKASKRGRGRGNKSLYEQWKKNHGKDSYDDDGFDHPGLTDAQKKFANAFHINLRGQLR
ncbi:hypothetical protein Tco_0152567 [Tanacetum coccineum]